MSNSVKETPYQVTFVPHGGKMEVTVSINTGESFSQTSEIFPINPGGIEAERIMANVEAHIRRILESPRESIYTALADAKEMIRVSSLPRTRNPLPPRNTTLEDTGVFTVMKKPLP